MATPPHPVQTVQVDVHFDLICPWCWIGKRHLDTARQRLAAMAPGMRVDVHWHSVQLIPDVPPQGWPYQAFYEHRLGGADAVRTRRAVVQSAAALAGLTIHHERMAVFPNTWKAHRLLAAAAQQLPPLVLESLVDALFETYFVQGLDLSDREVLATLAQSHGVDMRDADDLAMPVIWRLPAGASGVPLFVINRQHILSGAQPPDVLLAALLDTPFKPSFVRACSGTVQ